MKTKILPFILLASLFFSTPDLGAQTPVLYLDTIIGYHGDSIDIPVHLSNAYGVGSFTLYMGFGSQKLGWGRLTNLHPSLQCVPVANSNQGSVVVSWTCMEGFGIADGKLFDLRMKFKAGDTVQLVLGQMCEVTDTLANPLVPLTRVNGLVRRGLTIDPKANRTQVCVGDTTLLKANASGGFGNYSYTWASIPPGLSASTATCLVTCDQTKTYFLTVTDGSYSVTGAVGVDVVYQPYPGIASNLQPPDGESGLDLPISFSWFPGSNSSSYDFFVWPHGSSPPSTPTLANLNEINITYGSNLAYGTQYHWKVASGNLCGQTFSGNQTFTTRNLPDLVVEAMEIPTVGFAGQTIQLNWTVKNQGLGGTGNVQWIDRVFICEDNYSNIGNEVNTIFQHLMGTYQNQSYLSPGESYQNTATVTIPAHLSGNQYIIIACDYSGIVQESENTNNQRNPTSPIQISIPPSPDLRVTTVQPYPTTVFSGQDITVNWTVTNLGASPTPSVQWYDRVYLSTDSLLGTGSLTVLGTFSHTGSLLPDSFYTKSRSLHIPEHVSGPFYLIVETDLFDNVQEYYFEGNNSTSSGQIEIVLSPPTNLVVTFVDAPTHASENETIIISWGVSILGAPLNDKRWVDRLYLCSTLEFNSVNALAIGSFSHNYNVTSGITGSAIQEFTQVNPTQILTLPPGLTGTYYLFVFTDYYNEVWEYTFEEDNLFMRQQPIQISSPDLEIQEITVLSSGQSGGPLTINWITINNGPAPVKSRDWVETVRLHPIGANPSGIVALDTLLHPEETLQVGSLISNEVGCTLPDGIYGSYRLEMITDAGQILPETDESNNSTWYPDTLVIQLTPPPDLVFAGGAIQSDSLVQGTSYSLTYSVINQGTGNTPPNSWSDHIYFSTEPTWDLNAVLVKKIPKALVIPHDSSYLVSSLISVPPTLTPGTYWLFVQVDGDDQVYESGIQANNLGFMGQIHISAQPGNDLGLLDFSAPDTAFSGLPAPVSWTIQNHESHDIFASGTESTLFLSEDSLLDFASDVQVQSYYSTLVLEAGGLSQKSKSPVIPDGQSGNYFAFMVLDPDNSTNDPDFSNNLILKRDTAGQPQPIHIIQSPSPDLLITGLVSSTIGTSGQPYLVHYTVKNAGAGAIQNKVWTDGLFLSTDFVLDSMDLKLGTLIQDRSIDSMESYLDSLNVTFPSLLEGNFVLIPAVDLHNSVYEHLTESNNSSKKAISLVMPSPCDLVITTISLPDSALVGDSLEIQWTILNIGQFEAAGFMRESIYLSEDVVFDPEDPLLGSKYDNIHIQPNQEMVRSLETLLPPIEERNYHLIVKTDILNQIPESQEGNNSSTSLETMLVQVSEIELDVPRPFSMTDTEERLFKFVPPAASTGNSLVIDLVGDSIFGSNRLYVSRNTVPTDYENDFAAIDPYQGSQQIVVPVIHQGAYYIKATGFLTFGNEQALSLLARIPNFEISMVDANSGGNTGHLTTMLSGSRFVNGMQVKLRTGSSVINATKTTVVNQTKAFVTFNLQGIEPGVFDVLAINPQNDSAVFANGFTVYEGGGYEISLHINQPPDARSGSITFFNLDFSNNGLNDRVNPQARIQSLGGAPIALTSNGLLQNNTQLVLPLIEEGGPVGILRAGAHGTIRVYTHAIQGLGFVCSVVKD